MNDLICASLVYDGGDVVTIPPQLGTPRADQMQGTAAERLCELAGRSCYDSLGKGRPSFSTRVHDAMVPEAEPIDYRDIEGYHDHIAAVGHGSVWEHFNFTVEFHFAPTITGDNRKMLVAWQCLNRPGVIVLPVRDPTGIRITLNLRSVVEWQDWTRQLYGRDTDQFGLDRAMAFVLQDFANDIAPHVVKPPHGDMETVVPFVELATGSVVEPINDHERWITLYLAGSRGFSHEQVRHGDFTAISQRSTRYCDESESEWVEHPLVTLFNQFDASEADLANVEPNPISDCEVRDLACGTYNDAVKRLEQWLVYRGVDRGTARKQARGAARGYLGNALSTEMIFSASVAQWKRMIRQRGTVHADAEIRELYCRALPELQRSRYGDCFADYQLARSPDGIGSIIVDGPRAGDAR